MPTNYPYILDNDLSLANISDVITPATLTSPINSTSAVINVNSTLNYASINGLIVIDNEQIIYTGSTPTSFTGCSVEFLEH